jgi:hypothetical protein
MSSLDAGDLLIQAAVRVDESIVIDAQLVQNGRVQIADVNRILGNAPAIIVGLPVGRAALDSAAGQPDREGASVVIAAG